MISNSNGVTPAIIIGDQMFPRRPANYLDFRTKTSRKEGYSDMVTCIDTDQKYIQVTNLIDGKICEDELVGEEYDAALAALEIFNGCDAWRPFDVTPYLSTRPTEEEIFLLLPHLKDLSVALFQWPCDHVRLHNAANAVRRDMDEIKRVCPIPNHVSQL